MTEQTHQSLPAPDLPQLNEEGELSLADLNSGIEVLIPLYPGIKVHDIISTPWEVIPALPEGSFPERHEVTQIDERITLKIPKKAVHVGWPTLRVWYHVSGVGDSESVEVPLVP
ncbi:hypothetical protein AAIM60_22955 [Pseudomonas lijiangensis]|uniref:hypothetical protein n=1 Tax=Pseudomonas lijiangensis TaxID=2995658 RepID=UPI0031BA3F67